MAWSSLTASYYDEKYTNNSNVDETTIFTEAAINEELQLGRISNYSGYNLNGDTTFTYTLASTGKAYEMSIDTLGKVSANSDSGTTDITSMTEEELNAIIEEKIVSLGKSTNPTGTVISYMGNNAPEGYLSCDGTVYNISEYPDLAEQINNEFGSYNYYGGDGTTTFAVPDLRGEFLRGTGTNSHTGQGSGSSVGTHQDATSIPYVFSQNFRLYFPKSDRSTITGVTNVDSAIYEDNTGRYTEDLGTANSGWNQGVTYTSRPTNTSVLYCIKY